MAFEKPQLSLHRRMTIILDNEALSAIFMGMFAILIFRVEFAYFHLLNPHSYSIVICYMQLTLLTRHPSETYNFTKYNYIV